MNPRYNGFKDLVLETDCRRLLHAFDGHFVADERPDVVDAIPKDEGSVSSEYTWTCTTRLT